MGQKVNPISFRLQVHKNWNSRWFTGKREFGEWLAKDIKIRDLVEKRFSSRPTINKVEIERSANLVTVTIHTAKAGVVIGRGGACVAELKNEIEKIAGFPVRINIEEGKRRPEREGERPRGSALRHGGDGQARAPADHCASSVRGSLRGQIASILEIRLGDALDWLGVGLMSDSFVLFPPAARDEGYRRLIESSAKSYGHLGSITNFGPGI